jgi:hypothetical protein
MARDTTDTIGSGDDRFKYKIWKHNIENSYLHYYKLDKAFIIDYVDVQNPLETTLSSDLTLQTTATINGVEQRYVTFNKVVFYNSRQCSGEATLNPIDNNPTATMMGDSIINTPGEMIIRKFDKDWKINDLWDMRVNYDMPIFVNDWVSIRFQYFIDKILNVNSIDFEKDWTEWERFRDKYLRIRLTFDNHTDIKLTINYSIGSEKPVNI